MASRRIQSPRVKRESIRHGSNPSAFDRTHSGFQTLGFQQARHVRRARPQLTIDFDLDEVTIPPFGGTSDLDAPATGDPCGINGLSDLSALQARFMQELTNSMLAGRTFEDAYW
ncbi:unnamed protein product, partial [Allacma fusca]